MITQISSSDNVAAVTCSSLFTFLILGLKKYFPNCDQYLDIQYLQYLARIWFVEKMHLTNGVFHKKDLWKNLFIYVDKKNTL